MAVALPSVVVDLDQVCELGLGTAETALDAANRLVFAEAVGNDDDERLGHDVCTLACGFSRGW